MPRPRQRKGADARKEEKKAKKEQEEAQNAARLAREKRERERKTRLEMDSLPAASASHRPTIEDPNALPEPDPDTKAYFQKVAEQIEEMQEMGHGQREKQFVLDENGYEVEEEIEDERPLLLRSALESLSGHEITLAGDNESSVVLERLLYAMDDFAKRVLLDRFTGQIEKLVKHRCASHVLQTLFELAGQTVDRETRGNVASAPSSSADASELPTMTELLLSLLPEILPTLSTLIYDPFGSHIVRILLLVFSGVPCSQADGVPARGERSKKSAQFRKNQGGSFGKNWLSDERPDANGTGKGKGKTLAVPPSFGQALQDIYTALDQLDVEAATVSGAQTIVPGEGVRKAAMHEIAGPVMRILIELEAGSAGGWKAGGWADRVLCGQVSEVQDASTTSEKAQELREEYLAGLLRHPASSPTFEILLTLAPHPVFSALWDSFFKGKLHRLAGNAVANFVVAVGISKVDEEQLESLVKEVRGIATERRGEWIDNFRTGVLRSMLEMAAKLGKCEAEMSELMLDTFGLTGEEERKLVVPCILTLNRYQHWKKLGKNVPEPSTQGSVLLQTWLKLHAPHQQVVFDSIASMDLEAVLALTRSATSSRVLDVLLTSPTTPPRALRTFLMSLIGHYPAVASDRIGSRIAEKCFAVADVYLKDKIAASLSADPRTAMELQKSPYGHFFARKVELPLWERRRDDWKAKMARLAAEEKAKKQEEEAIANRSNQQQATAATNAAAASSGGVEDGEKKKKKKRERKADEVDEIFAKSKKPKMVEEPVEKRVKEIAAKPKKNREEELGDVLQAIKASM
ncbi:RNA-binding RNA processing protein NOP9 [Sporobolomyces salmoneus]|uniref:RNA-binding RNA processing protein NOP9 n=1 Tax=Sporobolomyces salmoneus TaxID=183962 RepID=UPI0031789B54